MSNISDAGYIGIGNTLTYFGPLLKPVSENHHATIITLFLNAVEEMRDPISKMNDSTREITQTLRYLPPSGPAAVLNHHGVEIIRTISAKQLFVDRVKYFERYMREFDFDRVAAAASVSMKTTSTIVDAWPCALKHQPGQPGAMEEFRMLLGSGHTGIERYVEWKRA